MTNEIELKKIVFAHGNIIGQLSNLLNQVANKNLTIDEIYKELLDITKSGALQAHELYYKGNKPT